MSGLGLLDVLPQSEKVKIFDKEVDVYPISAHGIGDLLRRFPELVRVFDKAVEEGVKFEILTRIAPKAVAPIIAAACGNPGDEVAEAIADKLPLETQVAIMKATYRMTMPEGFGPFVKRLEDLLDLGDLQASSAAPSMPLPKRERPSARQPIPASGS